MERLQTRLMEGATMLIPKGKKPKRIKPKRLTDKAHLAFVAELACVCCGMMPVVCHHLLRGDPKRGMGRKSGDNFVLPMCPSCHLALQNYGDETKFLEARGIYGLEAARKIWGWSHDAKGN